MERPQSKFPTCPTASKRFIACLLRKTTRVHDRVMTSYDACTSGTSRVIKVTSLQRLKVEALILAPADCEVRFVINFLNAQSITSMKIYCQLCQQSFPCRFPDPCYKKLSRITCRLENAAPGGAKATDTRPQSKGFRVVVVVDLGFTTLLTSQVISVAFYSEREKSDKFSSEDLISA